MPSRRGRTHSHPRIPAAQQTRSPARMFAACAPDHFQPSHTSPFVTAEHSREMPGSPPRSFRTLVAETSHFRPRRTTARPNSVSPAHPRRTTNPFHRGGPIHPASRPHSRRTTPHARRKSDHFRRGGPRETTAATAAQHLRETTAVPPRRTVAGPCHSRPHSLVAKCTRRRGTAHSRRERPSQKCSQITANGPNLAIITAVRGALQI